MTPGTCSVFVLCLRILCLIVLGQAAWFSTSHSIPGGSAPGRSTRTSYPPVPQEPVPLQDRAGLLGELARTGGSSRTLSGMSIRQATATTTWFLYPGACVDRALGTWSPRTNAVADSLQPTPGFPSSAGYTPGQPIPASNSIAYTRADLSLSERLWKIVDSSVPAAERPEIIDGTRSIWCGKFDANWLNPVGYPNLTYQILYIDTGVHLADYDFQFEGNVSTEQNYDYLYIIGGGSFGEAEHADPLENRRDLIDEVIAEGTGGPHGDSAILKTFTGSITTTQTTPADGDLVIGAAFGQPSTVSYLVTGIPGNHRALYLVFTADCLFSSEDGLWPEGKGQILDLIETSDHGSIYDDQVSFAETNNPGITGVRDEDRFSGTVLVWSGSVVPDPGDDYPVPIVSARVPSGIGELWQLATGAENQTADVCSPGKALASDLFFEGGDPTTNVAVNNQYNAIVGCSFPIPPGTGSVIVRWDAYLDLPLVAGFVQSTDYRIYDEGSWSNWKNVRNGVVLGALRSWVSDGEQVAQAAQADSIQVRWVLQCIPVFTGGEDCAGSQVNALLYDNLSIQVVTGDLAPLFSVGAVDLAQSTFIDGTIKGVNCQTTPCWPGERGSELTGTSLIAGAIRDNWNSRFGGVVLATIRSGLRPEGMGVNWRRGFDFSVQGGTAIARNNGAYDPAHDVPRMIFRLFDPATRAWGPFDSTELIADGISISDPDGPGSASPETTVINSDYRIDWPPYDKLETSALLPGGFSVNGVTTYASLAFLPRGSRMQYYFKGVDINGAVTYRFTTDGETEETEDLPLLPGGSIRAPDIVEFRVLPSVYPPGPAGSLLAGRSNTPVLNLDSAHTGWNRYDPVTEALRGLGVRADRYRRTSNSIGGHALPGPQSSVIPAVFPNYLEYPLVDSLAAWYRIMIDSYSDFLEPELFPEHDAIVLEEWWRRDTGPDQGDRCILLTGDNVLSNLVTPTPNRDFTRRISLAQGVFGVSSAADSWSGTSNTPYPTIDDRFAAPTAGPALALANTFTYPLDGACPFRNRFDSLVKVNNADASAVAFYPNGQTAAIARSREMDNLADSDRNKALAYGYSSFFMRNPSYGPTNANYIRSGVENRMRVLYKFLTSCRASHIGTACWPCPTPNSMSISAMQADWSTQSASFQTSTYGPLYPIQAGALATGLEPEETPGRPLANSLEQNRPNPFNPETVIFYRVATPGPVQIRVYDVSGRLVRTLVDERKAEGGHHVRWDGKNDAGKPTASGLYFYRISYPEGGTSSRKLTILR